MLPKTAYTFRIMLMGISCSQNSSLLFEGMSRTKPSFWLNLTLFTVRYSSVTMPYISPAGRYWIGVVTSVPAPVLCRF